MGFIANIVSILVGVCALPIAFVGLVPLLGIANYVAIPVALVGAAIGMLSGGRSGRNFNLFVIVVAIIRLFIGSGLF